ncbi:MAG: Gldg family protein [Chitinispirillaceae bacterium]|jgi:gliding-associated putative ABC transporter substrate-binding component GldG
METKKIKTRTELVVYSLIILGIVMVINYLSTVWFSRLDMTEGKEYTISPATRKIMKGLDDIINIKVYCSKNLPQQLQRNVTNIKDMLAEYKAYGGKKLRISWVDPAESENSRQEARSMGINEMQVQTIEKDKAQVVNGYLGIAVLFADRKEVLPFVQNLQNFEYDLTLAIMKVSRPTTPSVGILKVDTLQALPEQILRQIPKDKQQEERTEVKFAPLFEKLKDNYNVVTVDNIAKGTAIDSTLKALVIPGAAPFSDRSLFEIDQYFMKGGKLIVLASGMKVEMNSYYGPMAVNVDSKLLDMLQFYGVKVNHDMVVDASCGQVQIPQKIGPFTGYVAVPYPYFVRIGSEGFNRSNPAVTPLSEVVMPWPSSLSLLVDQASDTRNVQKPNSAASSSQSGVKATVLAHSSKKSWTVSGYVDLNPQQNWQPTSPSTMKPSTLAAHLTGSFKSYFAGKTVPPVNQNAPKDSLSKIVLQPSEDANRTIIQSNSNGHLVVVANADFVSAQNSAPGNILMVMNLVDWLSQDENLIAIRARALKDRTIDADLLKKDSAMPNIVRFINIITMPLLVIIAGIVIFLRRRETIAAVPATSIASGDKNEEKHV